MPPHVCEKFWLLVLAAVPVRARTTGGPHERMLGMPTNALMLLGTAAAAWQPLAEDSLHWSSVVSPCSLRSSTANLSAIALPEHA